MDRAVFVQSIRYIELDRFAFLQADERTRHASIDRDAVTTPPLNHPLAFRDGQIDAGAGHLVESLAKHTAVTDITAPRPYGNGPRCSTKCACAK